MRLTKTKFSKKGSPKEITVAMSTDEAASIAKVFGGYSPKTFEENFPGLDLDSIHEVYDCLTGEFFNRHWDDGVDGFLRGQKPGEIG